MQCSTQRGCGGRVCPGTWIALALLAGLMLWNVVSGYRARTAPPRAQEQREALPAAGLSFPDLNGKTWRLADHKGKVVLVNFWATWCPPCRAETPDLVKVAKEYAPKGVETVGVALDDSGADPVRRFVQEYGIPYPVLLPDGESPVLSTVSSIPVTLLIDRQGRIAKRYDGAVSDTQLSKDLENLLAET